MRQHDHLRIFIKCDGRDVEGLPRNQRGGRGVMHHHTADDPATAAQLPPLHRGVIPTTGTLWPRRELIPKAIGAILDYQPLLVASVVEGLVQRIGYGRLFGHIFRPFRFQSETASARLLNGTAREIQAVPPSDVCRQRWWSEMALCTPNQVGRNRLPTPFAPRTAAGSFLRLSRFFRALDEKPNLNRREQPRFSQ